MAGANAATPTSYVNDFETDTSGWTGTTRVASGTDGVPSQDTHHATLAGTAYTKWNGYTYEFPAGGYSTSVDVHLDVTPGKYNADTRFDWTSAVSNTSDGHRRDYAFNCGSYAAGFICSASNNTGRGGAYPANPARSPYTITATGWYTLKHQFRDNGGVLAVDLSILDSAGTELKKWTLSDSSDVIGQTVGGNRYGWFATQEFAGLAIDNSRLTVASVAPKCTPTGFVRDGINLTAAQIGGPVTGILDATGCDIGVYYGPSTTDGSVSGATISNARYFGVVNDGGIVNVKNSTIEKIGNTPFDGTQHGVGIFFTTEHELSHPAGVARGTISGNTLPSYQKGGIVVRGADASADILNNSVTGSGMVDYIAQNGIQVSFGASALVKGNTVTGNWYSPASNVACGLLFYQADGVKQQANSFSGNETNLCNVGRGGGNVTL